jgi:hypothetical protein
VFYGTGGELGAYTPAGGGYVDLAYTGGCQP